MTTTWDDGPLRLTELAAAVDGDPDPLSRLEAIQRLRVEAAAVRAAREEGASWEKVGDRIGISKQAANKRFAAGAVKDSDAPARANSHDGRRVARAGWEIALPGRRALLHIRPRRDGAR